MYYFKYMSPSFVIVSTRSSLEYAKKVVSILPSVLTAHPNTMSYDYLDKISVSKFSDGEMEVLLHDSVRGKTVILFTTCARNEQNLSVEECKAELYNTIDVLKRAQAAKIIVFEPYMSCSRSDRTTRRNSVGLWVHLKILVSLGADHILSYQMHSDKSKTVLDPCLCAFDDIQAVSLLQKYLCDVISGSSADQNSCIRENWLFCAVDAGAEKLARKFSTAFDTQLVVCNKQRNPDVTNCIDSITILSAVSLQDKKLWIVDDMIDTGGSITALLKELSHQNCKEINLMIVHPVLSGRAVEKLASLHEKGCFNRLVVCDTISCTSLRQQLPFVEIIESASLSAKIIQTIITDGQMSAVIDSFSPQDYLSERTTL